MTSSANDEWDYQQLTDILRWMEDNEHRWKAFSPLSAKRVRHAIDFIEYNMRELEITGGNGD